MKLSRQMGLRVTLWRCATMVIICLAAAWFVNSSDRLTLLIGENDAYGMVFIAVSLVAVLFANERLHKLLGTGRRA